MAKILPFPTIKRASLVERTARTMASMSAREGDLHLLHFVRNEFERQERIGIDPEDIEDDLVKFANRVRGALWHEILSRPGGCA